MDSITFILYDENDELIASESILCVKRHTKQFIKDNLTYLINFYSEDFEIKKIEIKKESV